MKARIIKKAYKHICEHALQRDINPMDAGIGDVALCTCGKQFERLESVRYGTRKSWHPLKVEDYVPESEWLPVDYDG